MNTISKLRRYIDRKIPLVPLKAESKDPLYYQWQKNTSFEEEKIQEWIEKNPNGNWGILPGQAGLIAIDIDHKFGGMETWDFLINKHGEPNTAKQITGSGALHYLFKVKDGQKFKGHFRDCKGIQTRFKNYIACEPSIHPTTKLPYKWERFDDIIELPEWILEQIDRKMIAGAKREKVQFTTKYIRSIIDNIRDIQMDYNEWLQNLMSIHSLFPGDDGLELAVYMSTGLNYSEGDEELVKSKWESFGTREEERTGRSLLWFAKQNGVAIPHPSLDEDKIAFATSERERFQLESEVHEEWFYDGSQKKVCRHKNFIVDYINGQGYAVIKSKGFLVQVSIDEFGQKSAAAIRKENFALIWADHFYKDVYINKSGDWKVQYIPAWEVWLESTDRQSYFEIMFDMNDKDGCLNLWTGIPCTPAPGDPKLISQFEELVFDAVAQDSSRTGKGRWLMQFLAHLVQKPWEKPGVVPVIFGPQGGGKGLLAQGIMSDIIRSYALTITSPSEIKRNFNRGQSARLLTILDEATWRGDKEEDGKLKSRVTEKHITVEEKFGERYTLKDFSRFMILSNNDEPVSFEIGNRRYLGFETNPEYARKNSFFGPLWDAVREGTLGPAVYHYLLAFDISDFDPYTLPRFDNQGSAAKIASAPLGADFWADVFFEGTEALFEDGEFLSKTEVFQRFTDFATRSKTWKRGITQKAFWDATMKNIPAMKNKEGKFSYRDQRRGMRITAYDACKSFCETIQLDFPKNFDELELFKTYDSFESNGPS